MAMIFNDAAYDNVTLMDPRICAFDRLSDPNAPVALCADTTDASNHELHFESGCNVFTYTARESLVDSLPTYEDYFFGRPLAATAECVRIDGDQPVISTSDGYHLDDDAFTSLNAYEGPHCDISGDYECVNNGIFANDDGIPQPELRGRILMRNEDVERYTFLNSIAVIGDEYLDTFFTYVNTTDPKICAFELWTSGEGYGVSCGELLDASMFKLRCSEDCRELIWTGAEAVHGDDGGASCSSAAGSASCLRVSGD